MPEVSLGARVAQLRWCSVGQASNELGPLERLAHARGKTQKRRDEFHAGRCAAHQALGHTGLEVLAREEPALDAGRPYATGLDVAISISHSNSVAAALVARGPSPIGLDLESLALSPDPSFASEAFAAGELEQWASWPVAGEQAVAWAWAAKEAVLKVWGVGLRAPLGLVRVELAAAKLIGERRWAIDLIAEGQAAKSRSFEGWAGTEGGLLAIALSGL